MKFDPLKKREWLLKQGGLALINDAQPQNDMVVGNWGIMTLNSIVQAWIVGLADETRNSLGRCEKWLSQGIKNREKFGGDESLHLSRMFSARALCAWMKDGAVAEDDWRFASDYLQASVKAEGEDNIPKDLLVSGYLNDVSAFLLLAGQSHQLVELLTSDVDADQHDNANKAKHPFELGLAIGRRNCGLRHEPLNDAAERVLRNYMEGRWISRGQHIRAATWLMIVHSFDKGVFFEADLPPLTILLKAYEYMNIPAFRIS